MNTIQQAHILLVDDNTDLLRLLEEQLRGAGYQNIRTVQNCAAAQTAFAAEMPELMILDINLPDGDGFSLFRTLRAKADVPTLFLSARDADADRLFGLGLGADDYLTKPFLMQELLLRVQHLLQRAYRTELSRTKAAIMQLGDRSVDLHDALVTLPDGTTLALTATERTLLRKLAENRGHIVTYDALCEAVWGADYYGYENSLGVHIRHLREKLEPEPGRPRFLQTVRGIGYKLAKEDAKGTLQKTLRQYFLQDCDLHPCAEALFIHPNTLRYRLTRIEQITGLNFNRLDDKFLLYLGLNLDG